MATELKSLMMAKVPLDTSTSEWSIAAVISAENAATLAGLLGATTAPAAGTVNKQLADILAKVIAAPATAANQALELAAMGGSLDTGAVGATTVGATTTPVLVAAAGRQVVILSNRSNEEIDVAFGAAAVAGQGVSLAVGAIAIVKGGLAALAINAICASGSKSLAWQTGTKA
jgi:hypothetical protein